jgi:PEP-CTERM motif
MRKLISLNWEYSSMKRWLVGFAAMVILFGGVGQASASFILHFDENGNGSYTQTLSSGAVVSGTIVGVVTQDPSAPAGMMGLTYTLPELVNNGDVLVTEPGNPTAPVISDLLRFTNNRGDLTVGHQTAGLLIYYSDIEQGEANTDLADLPFTTLPANQNGIISEVGPEGNNGFDWLPGGNEYVGISDAPEPATLTILGIGIAGMAGYGWRRRKAAAA